MDGLDISNDIEAAMLKRLTNGGQGVPTVANGSLALTDPTPDAVEVMVRRFAPAIIGSMPAGAS